MFDHLDDPNPHSLGTEHQLAAARSRGREIVRHRRRNRLAAGSAAVAATAGVTAVAVVGLPGRGVAGTAAQSSASPFPSPSVASATTPEPSAAVTTTTTAPAPPTSSAQPYPSPLVSVTVPAPVAAPSAALSTVGSDCAKVSAALVTTPLPDGFTPLVPPSGVVSWYHAGAPVKSVVVTVACHPFDPSQVGPSLAVKEVTVLDAHSWLIGDPATGELALTWNATDSTAVTVDAQVALPEQTSQVEDELLTLGNMLITRTGRQPVA